jgi:S-adenosylmethionine:tRNA-ribosyltransferase-isomerase (queuine synthetase)
MTKTKTLVGKSITIKAGTKVRTLGTTVSRTRDTQVTVRATETAKNGKTRVFWKSNGYQASALI